eukprot:scaffold4001_cov94-Cylindrotheca_fusiformis.AAC.11
MSWPLFPFDVRSCSIQFFDPTTISFESCESFLRSNFTILSRYARIAHSSQRHCDPTTYVPSGIHATTLELPGDLQQLGAVDDSACGEWLTGGKSSTKIGYFNQPGSYGLYMPLGQLSARGSLSLEQPFHHSTVIVDRDIQLHFLQ